MFDRYNWGLVPFPFWGGVFFVLGSVVGSFLNVCIHRMPRGESLVRPGSHCPHCGRAIPWYLNIPLLSWLLLRGRCRFCAAPISPRYFAVELLTGLLFLGCWLVHGRTSAAVALVYAGVMAGLVVATFIDFEHFIIPDEITLGGIGVGVLCSFVLPGLHGVYSPIDGLQRSALGAAAGAVLIYAILRVGKMFLGQERFPLEPGTRVYFDEDALYLPGLSLPYNEVLYRASDAIELEAERIEMVDRCYWNQPVRLTKATLRIGTEDFRLEDVPCFEATTSLVRVPREVMGLGDVKFMAGIGAFVGWAGVLFSLLFSAVIGALAGVLLIAFGRREWSSRIQYGPYISLAAAVWIFVGERLIRWWLRL